MSFVLPKFIEEKGHYLFILPKSIEKEGHYPVIYPNLSKNRVLSILLTKFIED